MGDSLGVHEISPDHLAPPVLVPVAFLAYGTPPDAGKEERQEDRYLPECELRGEIAPIGRGRAADLLEPVTDWC